MSIALPLSHWGDIFSEGVLPFSYNCFFTKGFFEYRNIMIQFINLDNMSEQLIQFLQILSMSISTKQDRSYFNQMLAAVRKGM